MAKSIYTGINDKARKVKGIYIGIGGKARKVKKAYIGIGGKAHLFYSGDWILGAEVLSSTSSGQTSAISGYDTYSFTKDTGVIALTGSKTSHTLSSLLASKNPVYTVVSSDGHTITLKRVTDSATTTTDAYYTEGSTTSTSSTGNSASSTLSGKSAYTFDQTTGQYSVSGSRSGSLSTLYSNGNIIYVSGGTSLVYKKVTDKKTSSGTYWSAGSFTASGSETDSDFVMSYNGYTSVSFNSSTGEWEGSGYVSYSPYEDDYQSFTLYQIDSHKCTKVEYEYSWGSSYATINYYTAKATEKSTTTTTYTITTYTKGRNYVPAASNTTYTVQTLTQTATEG